jgi:hypothetical protein
MKINCSICIEDDASYMHPDFCVELALRIDERLPKISIQIDAKLHRKYTKSASNLLQSFVEIDVKSRSNLNQK